MTPPKKDAKKTAAAPARVRKQRNVLVRATIHMPQVAPGQRFYVDPEIQHIAELLRNGHLVPVATQERSASGG